MNKIYEAQFVKSTQPNRLGIKVEYCDFFVDHIKRFANAKWSDKAKAWFFDEADYEKVRDLVIESHEAPVRVRGVNGSSEIYHLPEDHYSLSSLSNDGESF